ncbi:MAG TPA: hypothetical protein VNL94_00880 [Candidatus Binatia bacterium]|nr:hypothetical protein [Candidatus Binatia bacterium]
MLPSGARVVHIGPHKTGTTALQAALWAARPELLRQDVRHVGPSRNPSAAARSVAESPSPYSADKPPSITNWQRLVREFRRAREARTVVSSEMFAWAKPDAVRRIADDLDPSRIQVVVTLRPLARVIPSTWQQNVQAATTATLDDWVRTILAEPERSFWHLQRHDRLLRRWLDVVGPEHLTAVVVDDRDHGFLLRAFEGLLGVREGTLRRVEDLMNRGLTMPEAEALRALNLAYAAEGLPRDLYARVVRFGAAQHMKRRVPPPGEPHVELPAWAIEEVGAIQREIVEGVRSLGISIVGDLDSLVVQPEARGEAGDAAPEGGRVDIPPDVIGSLGMAVLDATGAIRSAGVSKGPFRFAEPAEVARVPTYQLAGTVAGRAWRATVGRVAGLVRRRGKG